MAALAEGKRPLRAPAALEGGKGHKREMKCGPQLRPGSITWACAGSCPGARPDRGPPPHWPPSSLLRVGLCLLP